MRAGIGAVVLGAVLLIAAVAGFIVVPEHAPRPAGALPCLSGCGAAWSQTAYDVARIGTWTVLIVGVLLVVMGVIRYAQRTRVTQE